MFNPLDIIDKELDNKTKLYNKSIKWKLSTFGKHCTYYIAPNNDGKENVNGVINPINYENRVDNYSLAFGVDNVGFDYSKLKTVNGYIYADYAEFYKHAIGAEESVQFYLQVEGTQVSRGDIISYTIQHKQVFYRISEIMTSYQDIVYRIQTKLIQVKEENRQIPFSELDREKAKLSVLTDNGITL